MQDPERLVHAREDRHAGDDALLARLDDLDAERGEERFLLALTEEGHAATPLKESRHCRRSGETGRALFHPRGDLQYPAVDREDAAPPMVDRARGLARGIDPGLHDLEDEEVVLVHEAVVRDAAFEVGVA